VDTVSEFTPHLTIYDGGERWYADQIARILLNARIDLSFAASGLDVLKSPAPRHSHDITESVPMDLVSSIVGKEFGPQLIRNSSHSVRVVCIRRLLEFLATYSPSAAEKPLRAAS
jgi:hypothetical protein